VKRGEKAGYPRFKSRRCFDSITFPSYGDGLQLNDNVPRIQGVGQVEVKGTIKTVTVKTTDTIPSADGWSEVR
jgi:putative transposase